VVYKIQMLQAAALDTNINLIPPPLIKPHHNTRGHPDTTTVTHAIFLVRGLTLPNMGWSLQKRGHRELMSRDMDQSVEKLTTKQQLVAYFQDGEKQPGNLGFGTEHEKFVYKRDNLQLLSFEEPGGYGDLFEQLSERYGWEPSYDRGKIVALVRGDGEAITLEPGGQLELSGAVKKTVFDTAQEFDRHIKELKELADDRLMFVGLGMNPFDDLDDVPWMPKARYEIMKNYLPTRGSLAHWMMKMTCTVQGNYDYTSEEDAADIIRTGLMISPVVSALFASSSVRFGKPSGKKTFRCHIWTDMDPDRSGFPEFMYRDDWGYDEYIEYLLDVPMFFIRRDNQYINMAGHSFRDYMKHGHEGHEATMGDFELHMSTAFPEVRMKKYIEVRGADAGGRDVMLGLPALWKGIFYHAGTRKAVAQLMHGMNRDEHMQFFEAIRTQGMSATSKLGTAQEIAMELLRLAGDGLDDLAQQADHKSERGFLGALETIATTGETQADKLLKDFEQEGLTRESLLKKWTL